jgi:putative transposase
MLIQKAFQYELRPDGATRRAFSRFAGAKRFVWNAALKQSKYLGYASNCAILPQWKIEKPWLMEVHSQVLQQGLKDLDKGFQNFRETSGTPCAKGLTDSAGGGHQAAA